MASMLRCGTFPSYMIFIFIFYICGVVVYVINDNLKMNKHGTNVGTEKTWKDAISNIPETISTRYILNNPYICQGMISPSYVILVSTSIENFRRRTWIRKAWGNRKDFPDSRVVFFVGVPLDKYLQSKLEDEFEMYKDLVQSEFVDSHCGTLKGVLSFRWATEYCADVNVVVKAFDDVIFNIYLFRMNLLPQFLSYPKLLIGYTHKNNTVRIERNPNSVWYIPEDEPWFSGQYAYPGYTSGLWVALSMELTKQLYNVVRSTPFFPIEDVYLFGLLPRTIQGIHYISIGNMMSFDCSFTENCHMRGNVPCHIMVTLCDSETIEEMEMLWEMIRIQEL